MLPANSIGANAKEKIPHQSFTQEWALTHVASAHLGMFPHPGGRSLRVKITGRVACRTSAASRVAGRVVAARSSVDVVGAFGFADRACSGVAAVVAAGVVGAALGVAGLPVAELASAAPWIAVAPFVAVLVFDSAAFSPFLAAVWRSARDSRERFLAAGRLADDPNGSARYLHEDLLPVRFAADGSSRKAGCWRADSLTQRPWR
jgi:hypothetical protein